MDAESLGGLGEVAATPTCRAFEARYRFFFNPIRYTSLGLAVIEAMMLGLPIVGLATTEMATAIENGVSGFVDTDSASWSRTMRDLLADPARRAARARAPGGAPWSGSRIERFAREWEDAFAHGHRAGSRPAVADRWSPPG